MSIVLDKTAMIAYARGSGAVGELIILVAEEENGTIALPIVALAEAYELTAEEDHGMLGLLTAGANSFYARLEPASLQGVGIAARSVGLGTAHAVQVAIDFDRYLVTTDAKSVVGLIEERLIIEI